MIRILQAEILKAFARPRSYIGLGSIIALVALIDISFYFTGEEYIGLLFQSFDQVFSLEGTLINGNLICFIILQTLIIQLPLLVALVTGDLISGESAMGTLRYALTKPISRFKFITYKWITAMLYVLVILVLLGIFAYVLSLVIFGNGDLLVLNADGLVILRSADLFWRFMASFVFAFISLTTVASLSLMFSAFSDNSVGPIVMTMVVIIVSTVISSFEMSFFDPIMPFLFTNHMHLWRRLFSDPIPTLEIFQSAGVLILHTAAFFGITQYHFNRKDIFQ
jgi:ABC-2 type transport system permease protein|tara:strand:+ start:79 stop:918 length:840 start_codon:yes stop_codon:yes gene_type:complete